MSCSRTGVLYQRPPILTRFPGLSGPRMRAAQVKPLRPAQLHLGNPHSRGHDMERGESIGRWYYPDNIRFAGSRDGRCLNLPTVSCSLRGSLCQPGPWTCRRPWCRCSRIRARRFEGVLPPWRSPREKPRRRGGTCAGPMTGCRRLRMSNVRNAASRSGRITCAGHAAICTVETS